MRVTPFLNQGITFWDTLRLSVRATLMLSLHSLGFSSQSIRVAPSLPHSKAHHWAKQTMWLAFCSLRLPPPSTTDTVWLFSGHCASCVCMTPARLMLRPTNYPLQSSPLPTYLPLCKWLQLSGTRKLRLLKDDWQWQANINYNSPLPCWCQCQPLPFMSLCKESLLPWLKN